jgi:hypothetical protein
MKISFVAVFCLVLAGFFSLAPAAGLHMNILPANPQQGGCLAITAVAVEGVAEIKGVFLGQKFKFFAGADSLRGIIGIPPEQKPGTYPLKLFVTSAGGRQTEQVYSITVKSARFPVVSFWLKPAKKKLLTAKDLVAEEWGRIEKVLVKEEPVQSWSGKFIRPVSGEVSMLFGTREYVNKKKRGAHRGLDLAVPIGTKVKAANGGRVVFAQKLTAFGGTIVVDHGQGIHTLYFHLSKFLATVGQEVSKGTVIALSGNSGISSGPHLHWGMSVHDLRVDPQQWTHYAF